MSAVVSELKNQVEKFASQIEAKDIQIKQLKDSFKKTVELVEAVANLPQEESIETPQGEDKNKFNKQVEKINALKNAINKTVKK